MLLSTIHGARGGDWKVVESCDKNHYTSTVNWLLRGNTKNWESKWVRFWLICIQLPVYVYFRLFNFSSLPFIWLETDFWASKPLTAEFTCFRSMHEMKQSPTWSSENQKLFVRHLQPSSWLIAHFECPSYISHLNASDYYRIFSFSFADSQDAVCSILIVVMIISSSLLVVSGLFCVTSLCGSCRLRPFFSAVRKRSTGILRETGLHHVLKYCFFFVELGITWSRRQSFKERPCFRVSVSTQAEFMLSAAYLRQQQCCLVLESCGWLQQPDLYICK